MATKKHIHKYHRVDTQAGELWVCGLPDCSHFMPAHYTEVLPGKFSLCWECGESFVLTRENMQDAQPKCPDCSVAVQDIASALDKMGI